MSSSSMQPVRARGRPKRGARNNLRPNRPDGRSAHRSAERRAANLTRTIAVGAPHHLCAFSRRVAAVRWLQDRPHTYRGQNISAHRMSARDQSSSVEECARAGRVASSAANLSASRNANPQVPPPA